jgi:hypothetical protein
VDYREIALSAYFIRTALIRRGECDSVEKYSLDILARIDLETNQSKKYMTKRDIVIFMGEETGLAHQQALNVV